jgi:small-conductance mechanosensitive channel
MEQVPEETEQVEEKTEVIQQELERAEKKLTPVESRPKAEKFWLAGYSLLLFCLGILYYLLKTHVSGVVSSDRVLRMAFGAILCVAIIVASQIIKVFFIDKIPSKVSRYNLKRITNFLRLIAVAFVIVSVLFSNWYTALVSLGVLSLILGFALQTPITSFIGWIYILIRHPYRVGDRIKIGEATGDVIDVSYLDTTLWEFGGEYLSTDHPSGRLIKFPNSHVLNETVYNYSWPLFPYIWNEIKFSVAYESDLQFLSSSLLEIAEEEVGEDMIERVRTFKSLLARTPVDELLVQERPVVQFRTNPNTWIDVIVRYLVHPKEAGRIKTKLTIKMLERLNERPDAVLFPKSNLR